MVFTASWSIRCRDYNRPVQPKPPNILVFLSYKEPNISAKSFIVLGVERTVTLLFIS